MTKNEKATLRYLFKKQYREWCNEKAEIEARLHRLMADKILLENKIIMKGHRLSEEG